MKITNNIFIIILLVNNNNYFHNNIYYYENNYKQMKINNFVYITTGHTQSQQQTTGENPTSFTSKR